MSLRKVNWIQGLWAASLVVTAATIVVQPNKNERVGVEVSAQAGLPPGPARNGPYPPNMPPNLPPNLPRNLLPGLPPPSVTVDVAEDSGQALYQLPGRTSSIFFDVTNWRDFPTFLYFMAADRMGFVRDHRPREARVPPGRSIRVEVVMVIPFSVGVGSTDNVTLSAQGPDGIATRSAAITVGPMESDTSRPSCSYTITQSCSNTQDTWKCQTAYWMAEVILQDDESGLLKVSANPPIGLRYGSFYAGTKEEVKVYFQASCCEKIIEVTAVDLQGNYKRCKIDVGVLNAGEIAAIVLGVLLLIAIIGLIVFLIIFFRRRRRQTVKL